MTRLLPSWLDLELLGNDLVPDRLFLALHKAAQNLLHEGLIADTVDVGY